MRRSLRKSTAGVHVTYKSGGYSNNLLGSNFELELDGSTITVSIDLTPNLRTRNTRENSYADAIELADRSSDLKFIQLNERRVVDEILAAIARIAQPEIVLSLSLGDRGALDYLVGLEAVPAGGLQLNVLGARL